MLDIGSHRQLFLDSTLIDEQSGIELVLQQPTPAEVALACDRPWESGGVHYSSVVQDGDRYRMWYRADTGGNPASPRDAESWICYAESGDGITWDKPDLGIVTAIEGGRNNILFADKSLGINPSVIVDPVASPDERFKMIVRGSDSKYILGYVSADGIDWRPLPEPILNGPGPFDSHNIVVRDDEAGGFVLFCRCVDPDRPGSFKDGIRAIARSESPDFRAWTSPQLVLTADDRDPADLHLYTNAACRYTRAAHAWLMFPMILYVDREGTEGGQGGLSDVQFAISRDGISWDRPFRRPFLSPDRDPRNWVDRNPIMGAGILQTAPDELSMYYSELLRCEDSRLRRCTIRTDGFVAVRGPYDGWGELTTPPLRTDGGELELNYRTTGGGSLRAEIQDAEGAPLPGFSVGECVEGFGDHIGGAVTWRDRTTFDNLDGKPIRLRLQLRDADLFSFRFRKPA